MGTEGTPTARRESFIHVEVDRITDPARQEALAADVIRVLGDVRVAVADWKAMQDKVLEVVAELEKRPPPIPPEQFEEGLAFLRWLADNHLTLLGYRRHELVTVGWPGRVEDRAGLEPGAAARRRDARTCRRALPRCRPRFARTRGGRSCWSSPSPPRARRCIVPGYLDYIAVKRFDAAGNVCGEDRFLGLYTSTAYSANPADIPLLRRKTANVVARSGVAPGSHAGKALINILANYPRDELFQITEDDLLHTAMAILHLGERQRFRLFVRRDPFERFLSCLIYAPRENFTTELRRKWQAILTEAFNGSSSEFNVHLSESMLARIQITVRTTPGKIPEFDVRELEARLAASARRWDDDLKDALIEALGEARGNELLRQFGDAFPAGYRDEIAARSAVPDIEMMAKLTEAQPLGMSLYRPLEAAPGTLRFKIFHLGAPVTLSDSLPMLEHMGLKVLDEHPHRVTPQGSSPIWIHDFGMVAAGTDTEVEVDALHQVFEDAFGRIFRGEVESDDFNRLVVAARMPADEIVVLRAYAKYMRQIGFPLSQTFIEGTLAAHADIAAALVALFKTRFDPAQGAGAGSRAAEQQRAIEAMLEAGGQPVRRPRAAAVSRADPRHQSHQFLAPRRAGQPPQLPVVQVRPVQGSRLAGTQADVRDLRLLDALRRRAHARRQGRARRLALVRPPGGLPHRSAGAGQGADGEEHRDRPGGLEGRLRAEARACRRRTATPS